MQCKKCKQEIADESVYCMYCGKKQTAAPRTRHRKRAHGTGTIRKDSRYKNPYIAIAPSSTSGKGRVYIGAYPDMKTAQAALETISSMADPSCIVPRWRIFIAFGQIRTMHKSRITVYLSGKPRGKGLNRCIR